MRYIPCHVVGDQSPPPLLWLTAYGKRDLPSTYYKQNYTTLYNFIDALKSYGAGAGLSGHPVFRYND